MRLNLDQDHGGEKRVGKGICQSRLRKLKSQLSEADEELASKLDGSCATQASEWEEWQRLRVEELVAIHDTIKLLNDDDSLQLFKETLPSQVYCNFRATREESPAERVLWVETHQDHQAST